jgi:hypothetical protein
MHLQNTDTTLYIIHIFIHIKQEKFYKKKQGLMVIHRRYRLFNLGICLNMCLAEICEIIYEWAGQGTFGSCCETYNHYHFQQLGFSKLKHTNIHKRLHTTHKLFFCGGRRGYASRTGFVAQVWISVWKKSHVILYVREYVRAVCWPDFNFENPKCTKLVNIRS